MVRIGCVLEGGQMATRALPGSIGEIPTRVTLRALHACVGASKRKCRLRVIEARVQPARCIVTLFACLRKTTGHVIGIGGLLEIGQMAAHALCRCTREGSRAVAL